MVMFFLFLLYDGIRVLGRFLRFFGRCVFGSRCLGELIMLFGILFLVVF